MSEFFIHPGAVGVHEHFRAPSTVNTAEDYQSGTLAAAVGGFVVTNDMPNTPGHETTTAQRVEEKEALIYRDAIVGVGVVGGMQPDADNLSELSQLARITSSGKQYYTWTTGNNREWGPEDFREQTQRWHQSNPENVIMVHAGEDVEGIIGMVAVDNDHPLHFCHVNSPEQVEIIQATKAKYDKQITCGVTPHHLAKSSFDVTTEGWFARMMPPLASQADSEELFDMFVNGDIDILETDHAPHRESAKWQAESDNPCCEPGGSSCFGVTNIEFALPLLFYQEKLGRISMERIIEATSTLPAHILGVRLSPRTSVTWDLSQEYRINDSLVVSGSQWSPFAGKIARGRVVASKIAGCNIIVDGLIGGAYRQVVHRGDGL